MRIAHFYGHRHTTGVTFALLDAAHQHAARGHLFQLLCRGSSELAAHPQACLFSHLPWFGGACIHAQLVRRLRAFRPDVFNAHSELDADIALRAATALGIPTCYTVHEISEKAAAFAPLADRVIAVSAGVGQYLSERYALRPPVLHVIPNGIDLGILPQDGHAILRAECGFAADEVWVGFLGRMTSQKNAEGLIRAFVAVAPTASVLRLIFIGDGKQYEAARTLVAASGVTDRVRFTGWLPRDAALRIVGALDALALPSLGAEGLSNSLLSALALGVPVLATDIPSLAGGPIRDGETGWRCAPDDDGLADGLLRLAEAPDRARLGVQARAEIEAYHRLDQVINRYETAYRDAIAAHAGTPAAR